MDVCIAVGHVVYGIYVARVECDSPFMACGVRRMARGVQRGDFRISAPHNTPVTFRISGMRASWALSWCERGPGIFLPPQILRRNSQRATVDNRRFVYARFVVASIICNITLITHPLGFLVTPQTCGVCYESRGFYTTHCVHINRVGIPNSVLSFHIHFNSRREGCHLGDFYGILSAARCDAR